jgi:tellurium resistance protein TerD
MNLLSYHEAKKQAEDKRKAILENHPDIICQAYTKVLNAEGDNKAIYNTLLEFGSETLKFLACIAAWEFRHFNQLNEKVDALLYELKTGKMSSGLWKVVFQATTEANEKSVLSSKITDKIDLTACSDFNKVFDVLINQCIKYKIPDDTLQVYLEGELKKSSPKKIKIEGFFKQFVQLRNTATHAIDNSINLGDNFYKLLNPYLLTALIEINELFTVLKDYHYATFQVADRNNDGGFTLKFALTLNNYPCNKIVNVDSFDIPIKDTEFLLDSDFKPYIKFSPKELPPPHPDYKPQEKTDIVGGTESERIAIFTFRGKSAYEKGQWEESEKHYLQALALKPDEVTILDSLASSLAKNSKYSEAEELFKKSLALQKTISGEDHPKIVPQLNNLAELYFSQGKYEQAEPIYKQSLVIIEKTSGKSHSDLANNLNKLAYIYRVQSKYQQAEELYTRAAIIQKKTLGKNHPEVAATFDALGDFYQVQDKYEQAESYYQQSLGIKEKILGKNHPDIIASLNKLADFYRKQERNKEAIQLEQRALTISVLATSEDTLIDSEEENIYRDFWQQFLEKIAGKSALFQKRRGRSNTKDWMTAESGIDGIWYAVALGDNLVSSELGFCFESKEQTKAFFDDFIKFKANIEAESGKIWNWNKSDNIKKCSITSIQQGASFSNSEDWQTIIDFMINEVNLMHRILQPYLESIIEDSTKSDNDEELVVLSSCELDDMEDSNDSALSTVEEEYDFNEFWQMFLEKIKGKSVIYQKNRGTSESCLNASSSVKGVSYSVYIRSKFIKCVLWITLENQDKCKTFFDELSKFKLTIETESERKWDWSSKDNKKTCSISSKLKGLNFSNPADQQKMIDFLVNEISLMQKTLQPYLETLNVSDTTSFYQEKDEDEEAELLYESNLTESDNEPTISTVSLVKGGNINLASDLTSVTISLGWNTQLTDGTKFDVDASAFLVKEDGKVRADSDFIFYNQPTSICGSVEHFPVNSISVGNYNQMIKLNLSQIPVEIVKVVFCVTIDDADTRKQNFGQMNNLYIKLINPANNQEMIRFDLTDASIETAMVFGEIYRRNNDWKFKAIGQGFAGGLGALATSFGVDVES